MKKIFLLGVFSLFGMVSAQASKQEKVKELMEITGSGNIGKYFADNMIGYMSKAYPDIPEFVLEEFKSEIKPNELQAMVVPIYEKHFTEKEIDDILMFYKTDTGKKLIEKLPIILQESTIIGEKWGKEIGQKVLNKLKEKYNIDNPE